MEVLNEYIKATNTHDFNQVRKLLHDHATYFFSDMTCTTLSEIQSYFENAWSVVKDENYEARNVQWLFINSTSAACTYIYFYEGYVKGKYTSGHGRATNVFVKNSNKWLLIHEHLSPLPLQ
ncbi:YybH family protein [Sporolactobacillus laevolacticus]|uniref:YybH family protein n=1 Tax=Sporolactobacillus laevolacticus TaxID=33018 RepID=UPI0025B375C2|nr:nuclear transport factor 2 family protein [Sporolactobacillus laevolacticus]MDN3956031.1 nuclear transport factor 2 family protein [Sporolactobacillus laevolacticus]